MNASQQPLPQPTQQDFVHTSLPQHSNSDPEPDSDFDFDTDADHCSRQSPLTQTYCPSPTRPPLFPLMKQSPNTSSAPSNYISPIFTYSHSNIRQQDNRSFKYDQYPQSFNRNHNFK